MQLVVTPPRVSAAHEALRALSRLRVAQNIGTIDRFDLVGNDTEHRSALWRLHFPGGGTVIWSTTVVLENTEPA